MKDKDKIEPNGELGQWWYITHLNGKSEIITDL